ncbi:MAG: glycosyltransferase family 4 protein [Methanomassiliicoccales archaeon]|nr:glycosyltransferase family 4 protein [Methanomassiliicoccales archaeon]
MRVAILSWYDFDEVKGGTELFVQHLQQVFPDCEVLTYSMSRKELPEMNLTRLNVEYERMGIAISKHFAKLHRSHPYDLVISNETSGIGLKLVAPQVPAIQVFHFTYRGLAEGALRGYTGYFPSRTVHPIFEKMTANGKRVVAVSHKTRRELERYYGLAAHVIENAVSLEDFRPLPRDDCRARLGIKWDGPIGIFVGRTDATKGFEVIQALARKRKDIRVLCVTGSDLKDENMIVASRVPNKMMPIYYSAADFLLFPSRYESASYTTIEAMACDLPMVAHRTGLFEDIEEKDVGRILKNVNEDEFSKGIDDVLRQKRISTRRLAEQRFSMDRFTNEYRALAEEVVKG